MMIISNINKIFLIGFCILLNIPVNGYSQKIYRSNDRWGSFKGDCISLIDGNKIYQASGPFCNQGNCMYLVENNKVFKTSGAFCSFKERCAFILDGKYFYECSDAFGNFVDNMVFIIEGNKIYKAVNNFSRGDCLYIVEENKVYNSFNPFGSMKDDCILIIDGEDWSWPALLAVLARRF